jgi:hypothetical protein
VRARHTTGDADVAGRTSASLVLAAPLLLVVGVAASLLHFVAFDLFTFDRVVCDGLADSSLAAFVGWRLSLLAEREH